MSCRPSARFAPPAPRARALEVTCKALTRGTSLASGCRTRRRSVNATGRYRNEDDAVATTLRGGGHSSLATDRVGSGILRPMGPFSAVRADGKCDGGRGGLGRVRNIRSGAAPKLEWAGYTVDHCMGTRSLDNAACDARVDAGALAWSRRTRALRRPFADRAALNAQARRTPSLKGSRSRHKTAAVTTFRPRPPAGAEVSGMMRRQDWVARRSCIFPETGAPVATAGAGALPSCGLSLQCSECAHLSHLLGQSSASTSRRAGQVLPLSAGPRRAHGASPRYLQPRIARRAGYEVEP